MIVKNVPYITVIERNKREKDERMEDTEKI